VGYFFGYFCSEYEIRRYFFVPCYDCILVGESVKSGVDFHQVELLSVKIEHFSLFYVLGVEGSYPVIVGPAAGSNVGFSHGWIWDAMLKNVVVQLLIHQLFISNYQRNSFLPISFISNLTGVTIGMPSLSIFSLNFFMK